jgi:hypothetical protein
MRTLALIAALAMPAHAEVILVATAPSGESVMLTDEPGPCVRGARLALWVSADAKDKIPGCYRPTAGGVVVVFMDGDMAQIPVHQLKEPTGM